ncbi:hypothetical protein llap_6738 [Limosa lapponica baueri]|uniref:Uncharacterized protein n=1 Tax=Limosa lapponica baueri TaxID=1758121 RepID=A0A2I0UAA7_LIMLA|nr:hypothetical protein llap_6738 [Limosa lapponica baueri]
MLSTRLFLYHDWEVPALDTGHTERLCITSRRKRLHLKPEVPLQNRFTALQSEEERPIASGEVLEQSKGYDLIDITETWWDGSYDSSVGMEGYRLFTKDRQGRQGGGFALYVNDQLECMELCLGMDEELTEGLWTDRSSLTFTSPGSHGGLQTSVGGKTQQGTSNPGDSWNVLVITVFSMEPTRRGAMLDLVLTNNKGLVGNVKLKGNLGCSDHEMVEFKILWAGRREHSKLTTLDFRRAHFGLFRDLLGKLPWGKALEGRGAQENSLICKDHLLQIQEQHIPKKRESGKNTKRPA